MKIIITGGSASGKSANAEKIICKYAKNKLYLATIFFNYGNNFKII